MYLFPLKEVELNCPPLVYGLNIMTFFPEYSMEEGKKRNFTAEIADKYYLSQVI